MSPAEMGEVTERYYELIGLLLSSPSLGAQAHGWPANPAVTSLDHVQPNRVELCLRIDPVQGCPRRQRAEHPPHVLTGSVHGDDYYPPAGSHDATNFLKHAQAILNGQQVQQIADGDDIKTVIGQRQLPRVADRQHPRMGQLCCSGEHPPGPVDAQHAGGLHVAARQFAEQGAGPGGYIQQALIGTRVSQLQGQLQGVALKWQRGVVQASQQRHRVGQRSSSKIQYSRIANALHIGRLRASCGMARHCFEGNTVLRVMWR